MPPLSAERSRRYAFVRAVLSLCLIATAGLAGSPSPATAQSDCLAESEPNDSAELAQPMMAACLVGTLHPGDQDLAIVEIAKGAPTRWDLSLDGVPGTATLAQLFTITSDPGAVEPTVDRIPLFELSTTPTSPPTVEATGVLLPAGSYLLGVARSGLLNGGEPATDDYRFRIEAGEPLPPSADDEPNDEQASAQVRSDAFEASGDREGTSSDHVAWEISEAGQHWDVSLQVPLGERATLDLLDADGRVLATAGDDSLVTLYDLALEPGRFGLRVREIRDGPSPYVLSTRPSVTVADPEPNDETSDAAPIADGQPVQGRLATNGDRDHFRLEVTDHEPRLRDLRLLWRTDAERSLCLLGEDDERVVCRRASGGINLSGLLLEPGVHVFEVSGVVDPTDGYVMRVDVTGATAPDFETEPNDELTHPNVVDPALGMRGRGGDRDVDVFRLRTSDAPQVWDVEVSGSAIRELELLRRSGRVLARGEVAADGSSARLADLHLIPGDHWLRVRAEGPDYSLTTTPLGPPDPDNEREPNDDVAQADRYRVGERAAGRLPTAEDRDFYRFTAAAAQRVRLDLRAPDDAAVRARLWTGDVVIADLGGGGLGGSLSWDLWLEAGDHYLELAPTTAGEGFYELTSERLDPYAAIVDREPNDAAAWARTVPPSLTWTGDAGDDQDEDWYELPTTVEDEPLRLQVAGEGVRVRARERVPGAARDQSISLDRDDDGTFISTSPLTPDGQVLLMIGSSGPYEVALEGGGWQPRPAAQTARLALDWSPSIDTVAAYWPKAQLVDASIELANNSNEAIEVELQGSTSHQRWSVAMPEGPIAVPPGETVSVAVPILVEPDAWGTEPVLVAARATTIEGDSASASTLLSPSPDAPAVNPRPGWSLPDALRGGLNVAAVVLGGEPGGTLNQDRERRLFDGATPEGPTGQADQQYGNGFSVFVTDHVDGLPLELVVDLAGDSPVPVAGTIINPQASQGALSEIPRDFELLLSSDGADWQSAFRGTLSPLRVDQAFVLEAPVAATHAMLRIWTKYVNPGAYLSLGEWKIVAEPGFDLAAEPRDIADPALGGHVVDYEPFDSDPEVPLRLLDTDTERDTVAVTAELYADVTVGFADDRVALVDEIGWTDPQPTDPEERLTFVDVYTSLETPGGPWRFLGTWDLERGPAGAIASFALEEPGWARYLRLRGRIPPGTDSLELPAKITVHERPTDEDYRSIIGEWGYRSSLGPYEALVPDASSAAGLAPDAGDTLADAAALADGTTISGHAEIDADIDWYTLEVPEGDDTLELVVDGSPFVGVAVTLVGDDGTPIELPFRIAGDGSIHYEASVDPGSYGVKIEQPPFSVAFAFDTSPSIGPYLDQVVAGIRSFLADVRPGREAATLLPFDEPPLLEDWSDDPYALQDAFENYLTAERGSSSAETALISASSLLAEREGARAILLITDGETSSYERTPQLWDALARVRPIIFSVHVGGLIEPIRSRQRMQDWAFSGGGHYSYPTTAGEMEQAFERMATWLRRPAAYSIRYETRNIEPARLALVSPSEGGSVGALPVAPGVGVEVILDTSGSMRKKLGGKQRIQVAKTALRKLLNETLAEGTPLAIRTFGAPGKGREANCGTSLTMPLEPLRREAALKRVQKLKTGKKTGTPIAAALDAVVADLAEVKGLRNVVLISDGAATCGGDPLESIEALRSAGIEVKVDVVGFALDDDALRASMAEWATAGGGAYYDAGDAGELARSIGSALSAPFRVSAVDGEISVTGSIDGPPLELDPGIYRVEVLTDPPVFIDEIELANGEIRTMEVAPEGPRS